MKFREIALAAGLCAGASAGTAQTIYESAKLGPSGVMLPVVGIDYDQFLGARFEIKAAAQVTHVGGHLTSLGPGPAGTLFAAIIRLRSWKDLPDGGHPFGVRHEIVATTTLNPGTPSSDVLVPLAARLEPGIYGLIFGVGEFGSPKSAHGGMPANNTDLPGGSYFHYNGAEGLEEWSEGGFGNVRFVLAGSYTDAGPPAVTGLVSAASLTGVVLSPGLIVSLFGTNLGPAAAAWPAVGADGRIPSELAGVLVLFDGRPAPLLFASARQINAVVPYAVAGRTETAVRVQNTQGLSNTLTVGVAPAAPALFTARSDGSGQGAILNYESGYSQNSASNPARPGSIVVLYGTGEGLTDPPAIDGIVAGAVLGKPVLPVSVTIGGLAAEVLYAGAAPQLVAGVLQVNVRVPEDAPAGPEVPVVLKIGESESQRGVTMAIR